MKTSFLLSFVILCSVTFQSFSMDLKEMQYRLKLEAEKLLDTAMHLDPAKRKAWIQEIHLDETDDESATQSTAENIITTDNPLIKIGAVLLISGVGTACGTLLYEKYTKKKRTKKVITTIWWCITAIVAGTYYCFLC